MSKADEKSLEKYPIDMTRIPYQDLIDFYGGKTEIDFNVIPRCYFREGYEQAEKDLALTIDDIKRIDIHLCGTRANKSGRFTFSKLSDEQYQEVLKRYNNER